MSTLQDFTVLPMDRFCQYEIQSSSVIFLPTKSPTENSVGIPFVDNIEFRR
jgi:hypothetical protein